MSTEDESVPETKSPGCTSKEEFDITIWKLHSRLLLTTPTLSLCYSFKQTSKPTTRKIREMTQVHSSTGGSQDSP